MELAIQILHILVAIFMVLVILLQAGKGAGVGATFGGAGSQTVFGGRGAQTFLGKLTTFGAALFFLTSLTLSHFASTPGRSVLEGVAAPPAAEEVIAPAPEGGPDAGGGLLEEPPPALEEVPPVPEVVPDDGAMEAPAAPADDGSEE